MNKPGMATLFDDTNIIVNILPWLQFRDIVILSKVSAKIQLQIQAATSFWDHIDFSCNTFSYTCHKALNEFITSNFANKGKLIRGISFAFSPDFSDDYIHLLHGFLKKINFLNLNGCRGITDRGLIELSENGCCNLESLELYWNVAITDKGLIPMIKASKKTLRILNISGCKRITEKSIKVLVQCCSSTLEVLDATRVSNITDTACIIIGEFLKKMKRLILYANHHLTPISFSTLGRLCLLEELDLCGCRIGDEHVESIVQGCSKLRVLNLTWCTQLTDRAVIAIAKSPIKGLVSLSLHGINSLTPTGIEALANSAHGVTLRCLDVRGCKQLNEIYIKDGFALLQQSFPNVKTFILHS